MISMSLTDVATAVGAICEPQGDPVFVKRVVTDSRQVEAGDLFVAIVGERVDGHQFIAEATSKGAVACLCNKGCVDLLSSGCGDSAVTRLVVDDTIRALGQLAAHYRRNVMHVATVVVAVTGTNGKTTTKCMIDHVLCDSFTGKAAPRSFNNHIGVPLTLLSADAQDRYLIVEIGSNSPGEVACLAEIAAPNAGVITSIGEAHLQGFGGVEAVAAEKASLLKHVNPHGLSVVNIDRAQIEPYLSTAACARVLTIGVNPVAQLSVAGATGDIHGTSFVLDRRYRIELPMPGLHHATNAAAAFAVARWFGVAPERIIERFRSFVPLEGRTRTLHADGVTLVDDSYNANPASMAAAIDTLRRAAAGRRILVMGDMLELGAESAAFHRQIVGHVWDAGIDVLIAVGPATSEAAREICRRHPQTRIVLCEEANAASDELMALIQHGDTVWVKGSRAIQLDRVVRRWQRESVAKAAVAQVV